MELKPCPFCGAVIKPFINKSETFRRGYWFFEDNHKDDCFLRWDDYFGVIHFGKAENGQPTDTLIEFVERWNRRANDV